MARGYEWAAANAEAAADILVAAGNADNPKLRQPLQGSLTRASMQATAPVRTGCLQTRVRKIAVKSEQHVAVLASTPFSGW